MEPETLKASSGSRKFPAFPILWLGPAGSGKIGKARAAIGCPPHMPGRLQQLEIGDYFARYWEWPTHMEMDVGDLSMMDKQILPEVLNQLLATRDVGSGGGRKIMILRRVHGLSPAAAIRLRYCMEELVWSNDGTATIWLTARTATSVVLSLMDGFVLRRCPIATNAEAQTKLLDAASTVISEPIDQDTSSKPIYDYMAEMLRQMVVALSLGPPTLKSAAWIRGRVYDLLGLMVSGADLVAGLVWATVRLAAAGGISDVAAKAVLNVLARSRWMPSYRTPLMYELIVTEVYAALAPAIQTSVSQ